MFRSERKNRVKTGRGVGVRSGGACFSDFRLALEGAERNLGGIEEVVALVDFDCADEDAMGDASDKGLDVLVAGEKGHGFAKGHLAGPAGPDFDVTLSGVRLHIGVVGTVVGGHTALEGGF